MEEDGHLHVEKCAPGAAGNDVVYLCRLNSVHPSNSNFKRLPLSQVFNNMCVQSNLQKRTLQEADNLHRANLMLLKCPLFRGSTVYII